MHTIFAQPDREAAEQQLDLVVQSRQPRWPEAGALLVTAQEDILAHVAFPREHWTQVHSTEGLRAMLLTRAPL